MLDFGHCSVSDTELPRVLTVCSPWAMTHLTIPPSPLCPIRKWEPFNDILPTPLQKSAHAWQNTKERFTAGLEGKHPSRRLGALLKAPRRSPSSQRRLPAPRRGNRGRQAPPPRRWLLQSSPSTFPTATQHSGYPMLPVNKEMGGGQRHAKLANGMERWDHRSGAGNGSRKALSEKPQATAESLSVGIGSSHLPISSAAQTWTSAGQSSRTLLWERVVLLMQQEEMYLTNETFSFPPHSFQGKGKRERRLIQWPASLS